MTAVIGIRTNKGLESVVIGADTQMSFTKKDSDEIVGKKSVRKIVHGENWIMAFAGNMGDELYKFYKKLGGSKRYGSSEEIVNGMIFNAVKRYGECKKNLSKYEGLHFVEVAHLNASLMRREGFEFNDIPEFVLAIYSKESGVELFHVDELGNLNEPIYEELDYVAIGSGSKKINNYIEELIDKEDGSQFPVDIERSIKIARGSVHAAAEREIYTGGIDLAVLTEKGVDDYGPQIKEALIKAEDKKFDEIVSMYRSDHE
ncbi:MAG: hypothetical protein AABW50_05450 [Nanoarchaeota archaeon]